jgi:hypothetical protein
MSARAGALALIGIVVAVGATLVLGRAEPRATSVDAPATQVRGLPTDFVANRGQWDPSIRFAAAAGSTAATFEPAAIGLHARGASIRLEFEDPRRASLVGEGRRPGIYNFFVGDDAARWRARVPAFATVVYRGLYEGVDVRVREDRGTLAYDVLLAAGADLDQVVVRSRGSKLRLARDGGLTIAPGLHQRAPVAWEVLPDGQRQPVESRFRLLGADRYGFAVERVDPALPLVIDPGLEWSTFLGGAGDETIDGVALTSDGSGDVVVAGQTWSPDFPHTSGRHAPVGGTPYVARLNATGTALEYSTFFGGSSNHDVIGLALDDAGRPVVVGDTLSSDFPTTPGAYDRTGGSTNGDYDAYVIKFDSSGSALVFSTFLGGSPGTGSDAAWAADHDAAGGLIVAGVTHASDFPTTPGAYDRTVNAKDVFVSRLDPTGSTLTYSTFLGGDSTDEVFAMDVDRDGFVNLTGKTSSGGTTVATPFPTTPDAFDSTYDWRYADGYVARLKLDGGGAADLKYSTFLGGNQYTEAGTGIAVDPNDPSLVTVSGWTRSGDFPTTPGALLRTHFLPVDASMGFVSRFRLGASNSLVWSTFFGGYGGNAANDVVVNDAGEALIAGVTSAAFAPTTERAFDRVPGAGGSYGNADGIVARLSADGSTLLYSTLLGGSQDDDTAQYAAWAGGNAIVVAGLTNSPDFPVTPGAFDTVYGADGSYSDRGNSPGGTADDAFVARLTLEPPAGGDGTPPGAPTLNGPPEGATFVAPTSVTLDWNDVADESGIEAYFVQVSPNPSFTGEGGLAGTFYEAWVPSSVDVVSRSVSNTGTMYWRIRALDGANNLGPWSAVRSFAVGDSTPPTAPVLESPPNGRRLAPGSVTFGWKHAARAQFYEIQIDTRSDFSNANKIWARALTTNRYTATIAEGKYFWRVSASNQGGSGPWSTVWQFEAKRGEAPAPVPSAGTPAPTSSSGTGPFWFEPDQATTNSGWTAHLTVRLAAPAPAGGAVIPLESSRSYVASVPPSVTVPAGATSATVPVTAASGLERNSKTVVSGVYAGVTQGAGVLVFPGASQSPDLNSLTIAGTTVSFSGGSTIVIPVAAGTTVPGRVTYMPGWFSPPPGRLVALASTNPDLVQVPPHVTIPAGANGADFTVTTAPVSAPTRVTVLAARSVDLRLVLELLPPGSLKSLVLSPTSVPGGGSSTGTVTIGAAAPAEGVAVALASSNTAVATVPASVTIPAGATTASFTVSTRTVSSTQSVTISATSGGATRSASLTVTGAAPAPSDTVSVTRVEYEAANRELRVEATSTSSSATLRAYVNATGELIGTLSNNGGGRYSGQFTWPTNPQTILVRSSLGGSATRTVTAK